ncbi:MAG: flavodoxin [Candidatus Limivicinus sp.]
MKKLTALILSLTLVLSLTACGSQNAASSADGTAPSQSVFGSEPGPVTQAETTEAPSEAPTEASPEPETPSKESAASVEEPTAEPAPEPEEGKTLVVYFSASGNTEAAANYIAAATGAGLFALEPVEPYTDDDLNWRDSGSRVVYEHDNPDARDVVLTADTVENWAAYDTVFIGYPIWWGIAAWPVDGFVAANDFTGKTVIPFCTSSTSGLGDSGQLLAEAAGTGNWLEGQRFRENVSEEDVQEWLNGLGLQ